MVRLALRVAVTLVLLAFLATRIDGADLLRRTARADPGWIAAALVAIVAAIAVSVAKWRVLTKAAGLGLGTPALARLTLVGLFFNNVLPTTIGGDAVRAVEASRITGRAAEATATVLADRLIAGLGLGLTAAIGLLGVAFDPRRALLVAAFLAINVAVVGVALSTDRLLRPLAATGGGTTTGRLVAETAAAVRRLVRGRPLVGVLVLSILFQGLVAVVNWCLFHALGRPLPLGAALVYTPLVFALTMLPVTIGGFGLREAAYAAFFAGAGTDPADAVTVSLLFFLLCAAASLPGAPLYWTVSRRTTEPAADAGEAG